MHVRDICRDADRSEPTPAGRSRERGLTLLELMIVATILVVIAAIGVPQYRMAL